MPEGIAMGVYLVTFESPTQDYRNYHKFVQRFETMRLSDTAWAVQSDLGADTLYHELEPLLGKMTTLYHRMGNLDRYGYEAMNDWLAAISESARCDRQYRRCNMSNQPQHAHQRRFSVNEQHYPLPITGSSAMG